jgi:enoyl-CoA hydratase
MAYQTLLTELSDGILTVTVNRPDKLNALNRDVLSDLDAVMDQVEADSGVRALLLTGAGEKSFVAGADISEFLAADAAGAMAMAKRGQDIFARIERCPKPVVAAVNGFALGGGCELAMGCHIRMASENARFGQPEVNLGIIPGYGGTQRLTRLVGRGKALEIMMSGGMVDAREALAIGLVNHVTPAADLIAESRKLLLSILSRSPIAVARVIAAVNASHEASIDGFAEEVRLFGECFGTEDMKEGVTAFLEKRKPAFPGR